MVILVKQREFKNIPILVFYIYALLAVSLRLITIFEFWTRLYSYFDIDLLQQATKLCVGIVQDWITLELAVRIRNAKGHSNISEAGKKKLRLVSCLIFSVTALAFLAYAVSMIVYLKNTTNICKAYEIFGLAFLG